MNCFECAGKMTSKRENVKYRAIGVPVTLVHVEVRRCQTCGEHEVVIPNVEGLHRALANAVIRKRSRLTPQEIVFLRKYLGWSGADFARRMGTTPETVSRWENDKAAMGVVADRFLRLLVAHEKPVEDYGAQVLEAVAMTPPRVTRFDLSRQKDEWKAAAA
jgi:putative zinc finger/helix-turn-helix YgiT family protein